MSRLGGGGYRRSKRLHGKPCCYCARTMDIRSDHLRPTRDHVIPQSLGGKIKVWCCYICNAVKRDMTPDQWAIYRHEHPEWWHKGSRAEKAMRWAAKRSPLEAVQTMVMETQF